MHFVREASGQSRPVQEKTKDNIDKAIQASLYFEQSTATGKPPRRRRAIDAPERPRSGPRRFRAALAASDDAIEKNGQPPGR